MARLPQPSAGTFDRVEVKPDLGESWFILDLETPLSRTLYVGTEGMAERARALLGAHDDVTRISYLVAGMSAADRALVRALAERLAAK